MRTDILAVSACLLCMGLSSWNSEAQTYTQAPVTISREKVKSSDGKIYYSHVVLEKQTLFSIAKAYGVSVEDIRKANPALDLEHEGLKKNSILLIPVEGNAARQTEGTQQQAKAQDSAVQSKSGSQTKDKDGEYTVYTTKWYEDLGDVAAKFSIPKDVLMKYNGLTSETLKNRQKVRIPSAAVVKVLTAGKETPSEKENAARPAASSDRTESSDTGRHGFNDTVHEEETAGAEWSRVSAMLMLPLNASSSPSEGNMDFYSGVLMAVKDLGKQGISTDLSVYDVAGGTMPVTAERLRASDFCIGPVNRDGLSKVLALAPESTYVISPLDHKTSGLVPEHVNMIQAPTSQYVQYSDLLGWLKQEKSFGDKVIVISEKGAAGQSVTLMNQMLENSGIAHSNYSYAILQGRNAANALTSLMTSTGVNRVIINSESEAFVNDAVRNLDMLVNRKYNVVLYSPSKIRSFETIDIEDLHNLKTRISTAYYIDYDNPSVRQFLLEYRALYNTEPTQFAFQGYDLAYFFISMKARYGNSWMEKVARLGNCTMMQTDFKFRESNGGGYVNEGVRRIVYGPDYSIRIVRR